VCVLRLQVEMEIHHLLFASQLAKTRHSSAHSASALLDLFADRKVRSLLVSCIVLQVPLRGDCCAVTRAVSCQVCGFGAGL
jgi:hypothetical protein